MKKILFLLLSSFFLLSNVMAHVFEIRASQAADGSITWYLISYHDAAECPVNTAGLTVGGVNYPITSVVNGDARPLAPILLVQDLGCYKRVNPTLNEPGNLYVSYAIVQTPFLLPPLTVTPFSSTNCFAFCVGATANFVPPPAISFTATSSNGSTGGTINGVPSDVNIDFCSGNSFTFSNYSSTPGVRVGALEKLESTGNVLAAGSAVPANRPQSVIKPSQMAGFFSNTYGAYTLASGSTGTIDQHYTPYFDLNNNNDYDAGDVLGSPVTLHYYISELTLGTCTKTDVLCNGFSTGSVSAGAVSNAHGAVNYSWKNASNVEVGTTPIVSNLPAGVYTLTVTDDCFTKTCSVTIEQPYPISVNYSFTPILCFGGLSQESITITGGTGPYTVTNQDGGALVTGAQPGVTYNGNTYAANYTYTVTDANGCTKVFSASITQPTALAGGTLSMSPNPTVPGQALNTIFSGYGPQSVTLSGAPVSGGTGAYTYSWSPSGGTSSSALVSPTTTTTFTRTVKDANNCTLSTSFTVKVLNVDCSNNANSKKAFICHNGNTICVSVNAVQTHLNHGDVLGSCPSGSSKTHNSSDGKSMAARESDEALTYKFEINNYPNPFTKATKIVYSLQYDSKVSLKVFDMLGRSIATLVNGERKAGTYSVEFDASKLGAGNYYYRINAVAKQKEFNQVGSMIRTR